MAVFSYKSEPSEREQTVLREVIEVWRMSALLMIQDNSVKCSDEIRNKPALLQYALGEDRPSLKHKTDQLYRLKDFSIGPCCILYSSSYMYYTEWERATYFQSRSAAGWQLAHIYSRQHATCTPWQQIGEVSNLKYLDESSWRPLKDEYH